MRKLFGKNFCEGCRADCCRYVTIELGVPRRDKDFEKARWFLLHRDVQIIVEQDGSWWLKLRAVCQKLDENNLCEIYRNRPLPCREFSEKTCPVNDKSNESLIVFDSVKDMDSYIESVVDKGRHL